MIISSHCEDSDLTFNISYYTLMCIIRKYGHKFELIYEICKISDRKKVLDQSSKNGLLVIRLNRGLIKNKKDDLIDFFNF